MSDSAERQITFQLENPIQYTPKGAGEFQESYELILKPFTMAEFDDAKKIEQLVSVICVEGIGVADKISGVTNVKQEVTNHNSADADDKLEIEMLINMQTVISPQQISDTFKRLAINCIYLDDHTQLKKEHINKMSPNDWSGLMYAYIENFCVPSYFSKK